MPWPSPQEYNEAIQNPRLNLADAELANGHPEVTALGLPRPITGNFASVYRLRCGQRDWAVRCFWREYADMRDRYTAIGAHLAGATLPCTVGFDYLPRGIRVGASWYPLLRMEWVEGALLNTWMAAHLHDPEALRRLARQWLELTERMERAGVSHGDLQHGNVLVTAGGLRLVDYDAMFVPALAGRGSHEVGHQHYQHPSRSASDFGPHTDRFSAWVIYLSIAALAAQPHLWATFGAGDEHLLLRREDYEHPGNSAVFKALEVSPDPVVRRLTGTFVAALSTAPGTLGSLGAALTVRPVRRRAAPTTVDSARAAHMPEWLRDHVPPESMAVGSYARRRAVAVGAVAGPLVLASGGVMLVPERSVLAPASLIWVLGDVALGIVTYLRDPYGAARTAAAVRLGLAWTGWRLGPLVSARPHLWPALVAGVSRRRARAWSRRRHTSRTRMVRELAAVAAVHADDEARRAARIAAITSDIRDRRDAALRERRERELRRSLRRARLRFRSSPDLSAWQVVRLRLVGIHSAASVDDAALSRAQRMGPAVAAHLSIWRSEVERAARRAAPDALSDREEERLRARLLGATERVARQFARRRAKHERLAQDIRARHARREETARLRQTRWETRAGERESVQQSWAVKRSEKRAQRRGRQFELRQEFDQYADVTVRDVLLRSIGWRG